LVFSQRNNFKNNMPFTPADYRTSVIPTFCPGCPNYLVLGGLIQTLSKLAIPTHQLVVSYDIGCAGNMADFVKSYGSHTLHGRSLPFAMGVKIHQPDLTVVVVGGDGGLYGEGLNHLVAAARMNIDLTVLVSNNYLYSLTTGQTSPTTPKGSKTKSTPLGTPNVPLDAVNLVKSINPDVFACRVDVKNVVELNQKLVEAIKFKGFALLETTQFCVAFGKQLQP